MFLNNAIYTLLVYILCSIIFTAIFFIFTPKRFYKKPEHFVMLVILNLALGPFPSILSLILTAALRLQNLAIEVERVKAKAKDWEIERRPIGERALSGDKVPTTALYSILNSKDVKFVKSVRYILSSKNDENRLLAFGYLQTTEKEYFSTLSKLEELYSESKDLKILKKIAMTLWEMILFDIIEEDLRSVYEEKLKDILLKLAESLEDETVFFILGRLYLREKNYAKASDYLIKAYKLSNNRSKIMPYLLESLFYQKRYEDIKTYCKDYKKDKAFSINLISNNIINFWCKGP